jgi:hypothetical protein
MMIAAPQRLPCRDQASEVARRPRVARRPGAGNSRFAVIRLVDFSTRSATNSMTAS